MTKKTVFCFVVLSLAFQSAVQAQDLIVAEMTNGLIIRSGASGYGMVQGKFAPGQVVDIATSNSPYPDTVYLLQPWGQVVQSTWFQSPTSNPVGAKAFWPFPASDTGLMMAAADGSVWEWGFDVNLNQSQTQQTSVVGLLTGLSVSGPFTQLLPGSNGLLYVVDSVSGTVSTMLPGSTQLQFWSYIPELTWAQSDGSGGLVVLAAGQYQCGGCAQVINAAFWHLVPGMTPTLLYQGLAADNRSTFALSGNTIYLAEGKEGNSCQAVFTIQYVPYVYNGNLASARRPYDAGLAGVACPKIVVHK